MPLESMSCVALLTTLRRSKLDVTQQKALLEAERCVLGITQCPERPLIIIDYKYYYRASRQIHGGGEEVWGWGVVGAGSHRADSRLTACVRAGTSCCSTTARTSEAGSSLGSKLEHCPSRCECGGLLADTQPHVRRRLERGSSVPAGPPLCQARRLHATPDKRRVPAARGTRGDGHFAGMEGVWGQLCGSGHFAADLQWGSRPQTFCGHAQGPCRDWGQGCNDEDWSYHMLGNKWVFT